MLRIVAISAVVMLKLLPAVNAANRSLDQQRISQRDPQCPTLRLHDRRGPDTRSGRLICIW
jgi:hypothetical protein